MFEKKNAPTQNITTEISVESVVGNLTVVKVEPQEPKTTTPIIFAPGFGETTTVFGKAQAFLAEKGRTSYSFNHPRVGGEVEPNDDFPTPELRKAQALLDLIDETEHTSVDIIAHSEGALNAVIAADLQPEKIRNIILVAPAGLIEEDTFAQLLFRFSKKVARNIAQGISDEEVRTDVATAQIVGSKYIASNPKRAIQEALAISSFEITGMLPVLKSQGIGIILIHHTEDEAFPVDRIQLRNNPDFDTNEPPDETNNPRFIPTHFKLDGALVVTGKHDDILLYPEKYTAAAEEMITKLEQRDASLSKN